MLEPHAQLSRPFALECRITFDCCCTFNQMQCIYSDHDMLTHICYLNAMPAVAQKLDFLLSVFFSSRMYAEKYSMQLLLFRIVWYFILCIFNSHFHFPSMIFMLFFTEQKSIVLNHTIVCSAQWQSLLLHTCPIAEFFAQWKIFLRLKIRNQETSNDLHNRLEIINTPPK